MSKLRTYLADLVTGGDYSLQQEGWERCRNYLNDEMHHSKHYRSVWEEAEEKLQHLQTELDATKDKLATAVDIDLIEQCIRDVLDEGGTIRSAAEYVERATLAELTGDKDE